MGIKNKGDSQFMLFVYEKGGLIKEVENRSKKLKVLEDFDRYRSEFLFYQHPFSHIPQDVGFSAE